MPRLISLSELIDHSWEQYRASLTSYLSLMGWLLVPGLFLIIALALYPTADVLLSKDLLNGSQSFGTLAYFVTKNVVLPLVTLWAGIACARFAIGVATRGRGDTQKSMREGASLLLPTLGATVLSVVAVACGYLLPMVPGFVLSVLTTGRFDAGWMIGLRTILVVVGVGLSAVFTVRWFGLFQFAPMDVIFGEKNVISALKGSATLVRGRFWAVLLRSLVPKLLFLMLGTAGLWVLSTLVDIAVSLVATTSPALALRADTLVFSLLALVIVPIFITPLLTLTDTLLFRSLKETV